MKRSTNDVEFILNDNGDTIGICLGFDFCAEHEWGIEHLRNSFGISNTKRFGMGFIAFNKHVFGIESRRIQAVPEQLTFLKKRDKAILCFEPFGFEPVKITIRDDEEIEAAWDERSFRVQVCGKKNVQKLKLLHKAFTDKDIAIMMKSTVNPFSNAGLSCVQISKLSEETLATMYDNDKTR
jgi:hypothetical protein